MELWHIITAIIIVLTLCFYAIRMDNYPVYEPFLVLAILFSIMITIVLCAMIIKHWRKR